MRSFGVIAALALVGSSAVAHPLNGQRDAILEKRASNASSTTSRAAAAATTTSAAATTSVAYTTSKATSSAYQASSPVIAAAAVQSAGSSASSSRAPSTTTAAAGASSSSSAAQRATTAAGAAAQVVFQTVTVTATATAAATTVTVSVQAPVVTSTVTQTFGTVVTTSVRTLFVPSTSVSPLPLPTPINFAQYTYDNNALNNSGVTGFMGVNTGIASWFRTNNAEDSTNGHSWCSFPYNDTLPGFAPSLDTMMANFNGNYQAAGEAYCGLEAVFTTPEGRNTTLYVIDAFSDVWVRTPGSVDVITGVFPLLYGSQTVVKNDVVQGVQWKWTGRRNERFKFNGIGSG